MSGNLSQLINEREARCVRALGGRLLAEIMYLLLELVDFLLLQTQQIVQMRL